MGRPLSNDLRARVAEHIAAGHSKRDAARRFGVSPSFAIKLANRIEATGSYAPKRQGRLPGTGKLSKHMDTILSLIKANPDTTTGELCSMIEDKYSIKVSVWSMRKALARAGVTYKKNTEGNRAWTLENY